MDAVKCEVCAKPATAIAELSGGRMIPLCVEHLMALLVELEKLEGIPQSTESLN